MRKICTLLAGVWLLCVTTAMAQTKDITGKITDAQTASPLSGVTVKVKGAKNSTVSNEDGTFALTVPQNATTLVFSYVGYNETELAISNLMNVALAPGNKSLAEVVVVGYGQATKRNITGSIAKVSGREVENMPVQSFESALQGKAAGVVIESGSGKVGQGIKIRVRGTSSITASSQPLYVVDGLPVTSTNLSDPTNEPVNPLIDINPNDIESIEVLKDASASAIYGARAANGVVLITTKKGTAGKSIIELNVSSSISNPTRKRGFLNTSEYIGLLRQAAINDGKIDFAEDINGFSSEQEAIDAYTAEYEKIPDFYSLGLDWRNNKVDVNWEDQQYNKDANANQVDVSIRGGNDKTKFFTSGFYNKQEAIVINNTFRRYGGRLNIEHQASNRLTVGLNLALNRSQLDRVTHDNAYSTPGQLVAQLPFSPLRDPQTGELNGNTLYANGLFDAQYNSDRQAIFRSLGNAYASLKILKTLTFRSELGADVLNQYQEAYNGKLSTDGAPVGKANNQFVQSASLNTNNYFTYTPEINADNKLSTVIGMSYLQNDTKTSITNGENFPSDAIKNLSGASDITFGTSTSNRYTFLSYFLRANYSFLDRYLLSMSVRADGSSRFGSNNRYGWFPAGSLGWVLSDEDFFAQSNIVNVLSYFKLRVSYGLTGNAEIPDFTYLPLYNISNYPGLPGFTPNQLGNPDLKWENTRQADIGAEFALLDGRISGELDYYQKKTTDLLLSVNIPGTTGYQSITKNLGTLENKGFEVVLNSKNVQGAFNWNTSFNIAFNKNKVTDIQGQIITSGFQRAVEGEPIGVFWLPKFYGVDPQTGDALYEDADGKPITSYSAAPFKVVGKSNPDFTGGLSNTFSYKGFDLNVLFTFVSGNEIYNQAGVYMATGFSGGIDNQTKEVLRAWKKPGDITDVPRASLSFSTGERASSRWIYDGSYIRMRTISLGYSLPSSVTKRLQISSARFYISGLNLLTFTDYPADPEVNTVAVNTNAAGASTPGNVAGNVDFYTIPQPKTITAGLTVRF